MSTPPEPTPKPKPLRVPGRGTPLGRERPEDRVQFYLMLAILVIGGVIIGVLRLAP